MEPWWKTGVLVLDERQGFLIICRILARIECNEAWKIDEYWDIKYCSCKKRLISKLVLECEDEIIKCSWNLTWW